MGAMNVAAGIAPMGARRSFDAHGLEPWLQQQGASATSSPISDALRGTPAASGGQPWWQGLQDAQNARQAQEVAVLNAKRAAAAVPAAPYDNSGQGVGQDNYNTGW